MNGRVNWSDKEWAGYLEVSERTARDYFKKGIIRGATKTSYGEWQASGNGLNRHFTFLAMARECGWKQDEDGEYIDPRLSKDMLDVFKPLFDARTPRILRFSRMLRIASAYKRAIQQLPIERAGLDELEEAVRWFLSSPASLEDLEQYKDYLPDDRAMKFIRPFFDNGILERAELLVAMVSAINRDGKRLSSRMPSAHDEWGKIRGLRSTGKLIRTYRPGAHECSSLTVEVKPNKASKRQFKALMQRYGRQAILREAKGLHPDTSDILAQHEERSCHEGAAHWQIKAHTAMDS